MSALRSYDDWKLASGEPDTDAQFAAVERAEDAIKSDREKVGELLFDNLPCRDDAEFSDEVREMANITAYAIQAWPIIECLSTGVPLTPWQEAMLPKMFHALKPWIDREPIVIREAAENDVEAGFDETADQRNYR